RKENIMAGKHRAEDRHTSSYDYELIDDYYDEPVTIMDWVVFIALIIIGGTFGWLLFHWFSPLWMN
ncbi:TPA: hypothetical protein ACQXVA_002062, partial [Streptococcus pneumoniae]